MKRKFYSIFLILTSLAGYLEWGKNNKIFLYEAEAEVVVNLFKDPASVIHPFTLLPLIGQFILLLTLFQKNPNKTLTYISLGCLSSLLLFMLFIGLISVNYKITISVLPFLVIAILTVRDQRKSSTDRVKITSNR